MMARCSRPRSSRPPRSGPAPACRLRPLTRCTAWRRVAQRGSYLRRPAAAEGLQPRFEQTLGGSDANNFNQKGLACLNMGLEMNNIHSSDEFMRPSQFGRAARLLERIICA